MRLVAQNDYLLLENADTSALTASGIYVTSYGVITATVLSSGSRDFDDGDVVCYLKDNDVSIRIGDKEVRLLKAEAVICKLINDDK